MPLGPGMFRDIMRRPGANIFGETGKRALRRRVQQSRRTAPTPRELPRPSGGVMGPGRSRGQRFGLNFEGFGPRKRGGFDSLRQFVPRLRQYL
jgi:hypothetical protein